MGAGSLCITRLSDLCDSRVEDTAYPMARPGQLLWDVHSHVVTEATQRTCVYQATNVGAASMGAVLGQGTLTELPAKANTCSSSQREGWL